MDKIEKQREVNKSHALAIRTAALVKKMGGESQEAPAGCSQARFEAAVRQLLKS